MNSQQKCECGAPSECLPIWHAALAEEQADPQMYRWHSPLVCIFLLQHRSLINWEFVDTQFRYVQLFVNQGIDAVNHVASQVTASNHGPNPRFISPELAQFGPLLPAEFPHAFDLSLHDVQEPGGGFVTRGHDQYGDRLCDLGKTTISAWNDQKIGHLPSIGTSCRA